MDLAEPGAGAELQRQVQERGISIDVLINNAGVGSHAPFVEEAPEKAAALIQLNCGSLVDLTARFLPTMTYARHGLVINLASTAAFQPVPTMAVYGATKAFVLSFRSPLVGNPRQRGAGARVVPGRHRDRVLRRRRTTVHDPRPANPPAGRHRRARRRRQQNPHCYPGEREQGQHPRLPHHAPAADGPDGAAISQTIPATLLRH